MIARRGSTTDIEATCPKCGSKCTAQAATASTPAIAYCWECEEQFEAAPARAKDPVESPWVCIIDKATEPQIRQAAEALEAAGIHGRFTCGTIYGAAYKFKKGYL